MKVQGAAFFTLMMALACALASYVLQESFLCDGQDAVRQAILYLDRSFCTVAWDE